MANKDKNRQLLTVAVIAVVIVGFALTLNHHFDTVKPLLEGLGVGSKSYQNVTMTDAHMLCKERTRSNFGSDMKSLMVDSLSSRREEADGGTYKIFLEAYVYMDGKRESSVKRFYVSCFVPSNRLSVAKFDTTKDETYKPRAVRRETGNAFGI